MRPIPKNSPRYQAALRRAQAAPFAPDPTAEQLAKDNRIRVILGKPMQNLGFDAPPKPPKKPPFQR